MPPVRRRLMMVRPETMQWDATGSPAHTYTCPGALTTGFKGPANRVPVRYAHRMVVGHAPRRRFLFPASVTRLPRPGPLGLTGTVQRTGPHRPVTTSPATMPSPRGFAKPSDASAAGKADVRSREEAGNRDRPRHPGCDDPHAFAKARRVAASSAPSSRDSRSYKAAKPAKAWRPAGSSPRKAPISPISATQRRAFGSISGSPRPKRAKR